MGSIVLVFILTFVNAIFASAEIAVISMNDGKLQKLCQEGDVRGKRLVFLTEQPSRFLATIQVAITLAGLLQSAFAADHFAEPLAEVLLSLGVAIPVSILKTICIVVITLALAYFTLVFGELVPKRIAMKKAEKMALAMSGLLYFVARIFAPIVWILTASTNLVLRIFGINPHEEEEAITEEEIRMLLAQGNERGTIPTEENEIILNVFEFNDITLEEICTHRKEVVVLYQEETLQEWEETILTHRHTCYPVCGESQDDVIGVLDTRDYFRMETRTKERILEFCVKEAFFVPEPMKANILLKKMKQQRMYFAIIMDEYGGMTGIVTLHDLMETLVGEMEELETPNKPADIETLADGGYGIRGCAELKEVAKIWKGSLPTDTYETFSGYICGLMGRVPADGETFLWEEDGIQIEVCEVHSHMVQYAKVYWEKDEISSVR